MIRVRRAVPRDAAALTAVQTASWRAAFRGLMPDRYLSHLNAEAIREWWRVVLAGPGWPRSGTLAAEDDGRVVGYARFQPADDADGDARSVGMIDAFATLPEVWGTGAGRTLMAAVVAALAEAGYAEATAWVFERDARARSFYRGQGWSEDGARDGSGDGFDLTIVRHRRPLPAR
ncbi:GNAT family N-acetyltransferase [Sphaerisporangium sp. NPDC051017]|uniref:GNAT family N-acetyltransferase n=1 Tax=Sphaerisporangium sp. NPDC051017 TaxID=3154636 RepID=UPI00343E1801